MQNRYLDGTVFLEALRETTEQLRVNREEINRINVFPVPDGDTGNNLYHTLESALIEAEQAGDNRLGSVVNAASRGAQNGSCGSSGAIFAQFLVGWSLILYQIDRAGVDALVKAMKEGTRKAYAAVLRPVEGTILTVARKAAEGAQRAAMGGDIADTLREGYRQAVKALNRTPSMLEALGSRGVIDAGGWGLLMFFSSLLKAMHINPDGEELNLAPAVSAVGDSHIFDCKDKYDLEFIIDHRGIVTENKIRSLLQKMGSELITRPEPGYCHLHIHADNPRDVIEKAASLAPLRKLIIRNMNNQFQNMQNPSTGCSDDALLPIAVGSSPGFLALFALAGAEAVVSEDLPRKISQLAREFREKNLLIIAAGKKNSFICDAPVIYLEDDARVLSALLMLHTGQEATLESISRAARQPRLARLGRSANSFTFQGNVTISLTRGRFRDVLAAAAASLEPQSGELLTLFYGTGMERSLVERGAAAIQKRFPYLEIEIHFGGQVEPLILAIE